LGDRSEHGGRARPLFRSFEKNSRSSFTKRIENMGRSPSGAVDQPQVRQPPRSSRAPDTSGRYAGGAPTLSLLVSRPDTADLRSDLAVRSSRYALAPGPWPGGNGGRRQAHPLESGQARMMSYQIDRLGRQPLWSNHSNLRRRGAYRQSSVGAYRTPCNLTVQLRRPKKRQPSTIVWCPAEGLPRKASTTSQRQRSWK